MKKCLYTFFLTKKWSKWPFWRISGIWDPYSMIYNFVLYIWSSFPDTLGFISWNHKGFWEIRAKNTVFFEKTEFLALSPIQFHWNWNFGWQRSPFWWSVESMILPRSAELFEAKLWEAYSNSSFAKWRIYDSRVTDGDLRSPEGLLNLLEEGGWEAKFLWNFALINFQNTFLKIDKWKFFEEEFSYKPLGFVFWKKNKP